MEQAAQPASQPQAQPAQDAPERSAAAAPEARSAEQSTKPSLDDLQARLDRLEKENRSLQSKADKETAAERAARVRAEREADDLRQRLEDLEREQRGLREKSIDQMDEHALRDYIRSNLSQAETSRQRERDGERLYAEADRMVSEAKVTDEEWAEYFDQRLADRGVWSRNPYGAAVALREGLAAVRAARKVRKHGDEAVRKSTADDEHRERERLAESGAYIADRSRGAAPRAVPGLDALRRMTMDEYMQHRDGYLAALKNIAPEDLRRGR